MCIRDSPPPTHTHSELYSLSTMLCLNLWLFSLDLHPYLWYSIPCMYGVWITSCPKILTPCPPTYTRLISCLMDRSFLLFCLSSPHSLPILFTILLLPPTSHNSPISMSSGYLATWLSGYHDRSPEILNEGHPHMIGTWSSTPSVDVIAIDLRLCVTVRVNESQSSLTYSQTYSASYHHLQLWVTAC